MTEGDVVKVVAHRPVHRDAIEIYVLRYRKAVVGYVHGGEVTEWTNEFLTLDDGVPTWHGYPPGGESQPFVSISGLAEHQMRREGDPFLQTIISWVQANQLTLRVS